MKTQAEITKLVKKKFSGKDIAVGFGKKEKVTVKTTRIPLRIVEIERKGRYYTLFSYQGTYYSDPDGISVGSGWGTFHIKKYSDAVSLAKKAVSMEWD